MQRIFGVVAVTVAFVAGMLVTRLAPQAVAQGTPLQPQVIDLAAMTDEQVSTTPPTLGTLRSKTLVVLPEGTMAVQTGNVPKHTHSDANEFQYVIAGSGTFWLGDQAREVHAGELIIIPKGTVHAGSVPGAGSPEFKVLAIKLPPQAADDFHLAH